jgi:hypothetical protein
VKGYLLSPPSSLFSPRSSGRSVPSCAMWTDPSSRILPPDVSVPACATWACTFSRPSRASSSSQSQTHTQDDSPVGGIDSPRDPRLAVRTAPQPTCASRPATCVSPGAPRPASRLTPGVVFIPATLPPTPTPLTLHNT